MLEPVSDLAVSETWRRTVPALSFLSCLLTLEDSVPISVSVAPLSARQQRSFTGRYLGSLSGPTLSVDFQHHLFPDMQNSFLENQAGHEKNHTGASGKGARQTVLNYNEAKIIHHDLESSSSGDGLINRF